MKGFISQWNFPKIICSELTPEKRSKLVYQIRKNDGRDIKYVPFVDSALMKSGTLEYKPARELSVGRKNGSRSFY